jgi:nucleoside-diphosphate-sugar epimerase
VLFEAERNEGVRRAVIASSAAVYGDAELMPIKENNELRPMSPYAVSKRVTEMLGELYTRSFGLEVVLLRYFNVYVLRQLPDSMYASAGRVFNVCSGLEISLLNLLNVFYKLYPDTQDPVFDEPRMGDIYRSFGSTEFTENLIGYKAQIDLANCIKKTADWIISFNR